MDKTQFRIVISERKNKLAEPSNIPSTLTVENLYGTEQEGGTKVELSGFPKWTGQSWDSREVKAARMCRTEHQRGENSMRDSSGALCKVSLTSATEQKTATCMKKPHKAFGGMGA